MGESHRSHRVEGRTMAHSIRCADAGTDCPGSFTTETKEELMKHVELHANEAHPAFTNPGTPGQCRVLAEVRQESFGAAGVGRCGRGWPGRSLERPSSSRTTRWCLA